MAQRQRGRTAFPFKGSTVDSTCIGGRGGEKSLVSAAIGVPWFSAGPAARAPAKAQRPPKAPMARTRRGAWRTMFSAGPVAVRGRDEATTRPPGVIGPSRKRDTARAMSEENVKFVLESYARF